MLSTDRAPIDYESIRVDYQTARAAVAATVCIVATILLASGKRFVRISRMWLVGSS